MRLKTTALNFLKLFSLSAAFVCFNTINSLAAIRSYQVKSNEVVFKLDKGLMKVVICKDDVIEVKYTILDEFPKINSLIIDHKWQPTTFNVGQDGTDYIITTKRLKIVINKATNAITYKNAKGETITSEDSENKTMQPATVAGINTYNVSTEFNSPSNEYLAVKYRTTSLTRCC